MSSYLNIKMPTSYSELGFALNKAKLVVGLNSEHSGIFNEHLWYEENAVLVCGGYLENNAKQCHTVLQNSAIQCYKTVHKKGMPFFMTPKTHQTKAIMKLKQAFSLHSLV